MGKSRKTSPLQVYNLLSKEVSRINRNLPEEQRLTPKEKYKFISEQVYPQYRGVAKSKIRVTKLRQFVLDKAEKFPKKPPNDLLAVDPGVYQDIVYYEIGEFIKEVMPPSVYVQIDAGDFGSTSVFNTRDFSYHASGVADITNNINDYVRDNSRFRSGELPSYFGLLNLRDGMQNDGNRDSYYILFELVSPGKEVRNTSIKPPRIKRTPQEKSKQKTVREYVKKRVRELKAEKSKPKRVRKSIRENIDKFNVVMKAKLKVSKAVKEQYRRDQFKKEKKRLQTNLKKGNINDRQYKAMLNEITKAYKPKN